MIIPNFKIKVTPSQSNAIQKLIFKLGSRWSGGARHVQSTNYPYLFYSSDILLGCSDYTISFDTDLRQEYTYLKLMEDLLRHDLNTRQETPNFAVKVNPEQSRAIQQKMLEVGYRWRSSGREIVNTTFEYLFTQYDEPHKNLLCGTYWDEEQFLSTPLCPVEEVYEFLNIPISIPTVIDEDHLNILLETLNTEEVRDQPVEIPVNRMTGFGTGHNIGVTIDSSEDLLEFGIRRRDENIPANTSNNQDSSPWPDIEEIIDKFRRLLGEV